MLTNIASTMLRASPPAQPASASLGPAARYVKIRESGLRGRGAWSRGCQRPLVSEYDAASEAASRHPVYLGCVYGRGQRPDGTQDAGQPRNGRSPAISRWRPRLLVQTLASSKQ